MPTYQYACTACAERLEVVQKFTDDALTECPSCGGALRKVFSAVGVVFKGSGFYKTDSRSSGSSAAKPDAAKGDAAKPAEPAPAASSGESSAPAPKPSSTGTETAAAS